MKITKTYLRQVIQEELEAVVEGEAEGAVPLTGGQMDFVAGVLTALEDFLKTVGIDITLTY